MGKIKSKILYHGAYISIGALGVLVFVLLSCPNLSRAEALSSSDFTANDVYDSPDGISSQAETGQLTQVWVKPTISIALANEMDIEAQGRFANGVADLRVATNSEAGLKVFVNSTDTTDLVEISDSKKRIPTISSAAKPADFPESGWGYYVDNNEPDVNSFYKPLATTASEAKSIGTPGANNTLKLGIGVKSGTNTSVGLYENKLIVSAIANPTAVVTLSSLKRMQDMTPEVCKNTPDYVSTSNYARKQLLDDRGTTKKSYWVAKLKDGNCWMQENLALDLGNNVTLTPTDTDLAPGSANKTITSGWYHPNSYWYYDWIAATATSGTRATTDGVEARDSICPKGWQMPLASTKYNTLAKNNPDKKVGSGSYYDLLISYGVEDYSSMVNIGMAVPLSFYWAGRVDSGGGMMYVASEGYYWSRESASENTAYLLWWYSGIRGIERSAKLGKLTYAFSVRCIARQKAR